ncbi:hypothetical protein IQ259_11160 [Fortiea sp. LEGE XX443]|uniref:hypothetical protein n=1 Tax=Fortiea sp. LEGE XX443 TaxID=1828611 RepID=UPI00187F37D4|nr:hypothetical protein [Fortiea sp. LEGE XX443]MBE9005589.1 hypothetical protein [Fortiea sp. LEGE XX443]
MKHMIANFRKIMVVFLVGFMFLLGQAFSFVNVAQADVVTPEGRYYKGTPDQQTDIRNDNQIRNAQNKLRDTADNVREKLNLDEETPRATKEFRDSLRNKVENRYDRANESREGYYQNPPSKQLRDRM